MTRTVTDETGTVHVLERSLGRGGQGEVWLAQGGKRVVKLLPRKGDAEGLRRQIAWVKRLALTDLHVARPVAVLRAPDVGYVAEFLEDMAPIRTLISPPKEGKVTEWYLGTGGLRRRLVLLAHAAETLAELHGRGLVYGDVSHENVFVSASAGALEAWLIDLDNLRYHTGADHSLYTPGYGAPEIIDGSRGADSYSDAWAFAILAFRVLALIHPLHGDLVEEGEPKLEDEANAGRLPWVEHDTDPRNRSSRGLPRDVVLTKKLRALLRDTFEAGVTDRTRRSTVSKWVEHLHRAGDGTVSCEGCRGTYYVTQPTCPFCDLERPPVQNVQLVPWVPAEGLAPMRSALGGAGERLPLGREPLILRRRHAFLESGIQGRRPAALVELVDRGVRVRPSGSPLWLTEPGKVEGAAKPIPERGVLLPLLETPDRSHVVHFGLGSAPHRVMIFHRGGR